MPTDPPGNVGVVIVSVAVAACTVIDSLAEATCCAASCTCTVNEDVPAVVGVPLICPELPSVKPAGREPELTDQLYGVLPPLAASEAE